MNYRILGLSGLRVSAVGLGCMGMSHAYGAPADKREMKNLLADAVDIGYTFFDTAEAYGTPQNPHDNEELLGEALKPLRDHVVIATKFGISFDKPSQIALAWMLCKRPWMVPIPSTRHLCRLKENIGAADIALTMEEVWKIDEELDNMKMSEVFGGSPIRKVV